MPQPFTGLLAYPITPLTHDGEPDLVALAHLVRGAAQAGVAGIAVLATSGAGVSFDRAERQSVVEAAVAASQGAADAGGAAVPVYTAVSAAATRQTVQFARDAQSAGAAGMLLAPFSYLPLSDAEVRGLFAEVADATDMPVCFYNKPLQTQYDLTPETLHHLAGAGTVVAVKETMRRENIASRVRTLREAAGADFSLGLSADVQLLAEQPDVDAWHTGLAALMPTEYAHVWNSRNSPSGKNRNGAEQESSLTRLQAVALALAGMPHSVGALHALARELGIATSDPRGPLGAASDAETVALRAALTSAAIQPLLG